MIFYGPLLAAAALQSGSSASVSVPKLALVLSYKTPTVTGVNPQTVSVPKLGLSLSYKTPTVSAADPQLVQVPKLPLYLGFSAPSVSAQDDRIQVIEITGGYPVPKKKSERRVSTAKKIKVEYYEEPNPITVQVPKYSMALRLYSPAVAIAPGPMLKKVLKAHSLALHLAAVG